MELSVLFPLGIMIYTDLRRRYVRLECLILFGVLQLGSSLWLSGWRFTVSCMIINLLFLFLWGGAAVLFLRQKKKFACKGWQDCIGTGDILFLLLLTPVWCLRSFVIFLLAGAVVSLICNRVYFSLHTGQQGTIPLVGTLGLCYVFFVVTHFIQT